MLTEAVIDPTRDTLDLKVFNQEDGRYVLKSEIRRQILDVVAEAVDLPIVGLFIKGSILSRPWLEESDVDVLIETDLDVSDEDYERVKDQLKDLNVLVVGTQHPLQLFIIRGEYDRTRADGLYDVRDDKWIAGPYDIEINVEDYWEHFEEVVHDIDLTKAELERDLIDHDVFSRLQARDVAGLEKRLTGKIEEINDSVEALVAQYQHLSDLRDYAFEKELSPQEIRAYGSKNALPDNVVFKLLQRYHYILFLKELKRLVKHDEIDSEMDVEKVKEIISKT